MLGEDVALPHETEGPLTLRDPTPVATRNREKDWQRCRAASGARGRNRL